MNRPYLLLLVPLGLALGYGSGRFLGKAPTTDEALPEVATSQSQAPSIHQQKRDLWRSRFLKILEEPSFSQQSATYYALATQLPTEEMPYFLEGMYPEGWTRFRGDLPLALYMEWAKRESSGLAAFSEQLLNQYPDLKDNLDGVFFNLGLQDAPGAIATLESISDEATKSSLSNQFIRGLQDNHPGKLFPARLRLLGPEIAFANFSEAELDFAVQEFWSAPDRYQKANVQLSPLLALEIGRRYQEQGIQVLENNPQLYLTLIGAIATSGTASPQTTERLNSTWINWNELNRLLNAEEKHTLLSFLSTQEDYWKSNQIKVSPDILSTGLDRELTEKLLSIPQMPEWTLNYVLFNATKLYSRDEYIQLVGSFDETTRSAGLNSFINSKSPQESLELLKQLPSDWNNSELVNNALQKALQQGNTATFDQICAQFPEHEAFLPNGEMASNVLWHTNPELYLKNLEGLENEAKEHHLQMIASFAEEEELGLILESGTFDQQTDVLIGLIHSKPILSTEILKHEAPDSIDSQQAARIGVSLAYSAPPETTLSYFKTSDINQASSQIAVLNFCLSEAMMQKDATTSAKIAQISPQHDYLVRTATAFREETDDPAQLLSLRQENPETFVNALTSLIEQDHEDSIRQRAKKLLASPSIPAAEKLRIHQALYGGPRS